MSLASASTFKIGCVEVVVVVAVVVAVVFVGFLVAEIVVDCCLALC